VQTTTNVRRTLARGLAFVGHVGIGNLFGVIVP
jgi:hypothetical protein